MLGSIGSSRVPRLLLPASPEARAYIGVAWRTRTRALSVQAGPSVDNVGVLDSSVWGRWLQNRLLAAPCVQFFETGVPPMPSHTSREYENELRELRAHLLAMGARCERLVGAAFEAFCKGAPDAVHEAQSLDEQIDRDELEIHALILRM